MVLYIFKENGETEAREVKLAGPTSRRPGKGTVKTCMPRPLPLPGACQATPGWKEGSVPSAAQEDEAPHQASLLSPALWASKRKALP